MKHEQHNENHTVQVPPQNFYTPPVDEDVSTWENEGGYAA